jgi:hypothetical protein
LDIIGGYKNIVENKKTDKCTVQEKNKAWENIAAEFNANNLVQNPRKWTQLRTLLEHINHDAKKAKSFERVSFF